MKTAGILLAAGYSSRMGSLKAALPFAGRSVIQRQIEAMAMAGCDPILVVTGHEREAVERLCERARVRVNKRKDADRSVPEIVCIHNTEYDNGMYTSVQTGVKAVPDRACGFIILPVDCLRISPKLIRQVIEAGEMQKDKVILPAFEKETGHPPWFPISFKDEIMQSQGPLNVLVEKALETGKTSEMRTDDIAILWDMDTREDYEKMLKYESELPDTIWEELLAGMELPSYTMAHSRAVAALSKQWAEKINANHPRRMDAKIAYAGGLLHDMAKKLPGHEHEGAKILRWQGFDRLADIIEAHMNLPDWDGKTITEKEIVYAADKVVLEADQVSVEERYRYAKKKYGKTPEIIKGIEAGEKKALAVMACIEELFHE